MEQRLSRSLRNPLRPSKQDLVEHGIYIDATPRELQMEVGWLEAYRVFLCLPTFDYIVLTTFIFSF